MASDDFQSLKDSIEANGVLNPITIFEGMVIDGWHRYQAANELAMPCPEQALDDLIDPKDFVLAQNKNRRHITVAQLATATAAVYKWRSVGKPNSALSTELKTTKEIAAIAGISERSVEQAKAIQEKAAPEVKQAVKDGKIGLPKAVAISKLPQEEQVAAMSKPLPRSQVADFKAKQEERMKREQDESLEAVNFTLQNELSKLREALALGDLPEYERIDAKEIIDRLRKEVEDLKAELVSVKAQRDEYMALNADMQRQIKRLNRA